MCSTGICEVILQYCFQSGWPFLAKITRITKGCSGNINAKHLVTTKMATFEGPQRPLVNVYVYMCIKYITTEQVTLTLIPNKTTTKNEYKININNNNNVVRNNCLQSNSQGRNKAKGA